MTLQPFTTDWHAAGGRAVHRTLRRRFEAEARREFPAFTEDQIETAATVKMRAWYRQRGVRMWAARRANAARRAHQAAQAL